MALSDLDQQCFQEDKFMFSRTRVKKLLQITEKMFSMNFLNG